LLFWLGRYEEVGRDDALRGNAAKRSLLKYADWHIIVLAA